MATKSKPDFSKPPVVKTRREKVAERVARAAQDDPQEAANAAAILATMEDTRPRLDIIADEVRAEWGKGIEAQFSIGRLLAEAYTLFDGNDKGYGQWVAAQKFPFKGTVARLLRAGSEREDEVRQYLAHRTSDGQSDISVQTAVAYLSAGNGKQVASRPNPEVEPVTDTTPVDPAYAALRQAHQLIVEGGAFSTMHVDDLAKCAAYIKALAGAYNEAKASRAG
jgi:hypothetical protein